VVSETKVTVAIPTYNRSQLLKSCLESVLTQDYDDFRIVVLDNSSSDDTATVVRSFADSRITFMRNKSNLGLYRNWTRAIQIKSSPYLAILPDDDMMLPGFLSESVSALDKFPQAGFSFGLTRYMDHTGAPLHLQELKNLKDGCISGLDYLHQIVDGRLWVIQVPSVMMRSSALKAVGPFDIPHSHYSFDFNLYLRLAAQFDIGFIRKELACVRLHTGQDSQLRFRSSGGTGQLTVMADRMDAVGYLMQSVRVEDTSYRRWLAERLLYLNGRRSELTSQLLPDLNLPLSERLQIAIEEIAGLIPAQNSFILVDQDQWGLKMIPDRHFIPFLERDGKYWGCPPDDDTAIRELNRLRKGGANFIVFGWPAFWWLDYYGDLRDHLTTNFRCKVQLII
jgi:glycosyltransferase involved in cell wall biosynthesis